MESLYPRSSNVIELTAFDFIQKTVTADSFKTGGLINFYVPWCPPCKEMRDLWMELAVQFKGKFAIGAVNCELPFNYILRSRFSIRSYPTVKYVTKKGLVKNYTGELTRDALIIFICEKL